MGVITNLTRMWLTRSVKPFLFTDEPAPQTSFKGCRNLGLYLHIPFCSSICGFCPYCKVLYQEELCSRYIDALIREIHRTGNSLGKKKTVTSLYIGGGTPALAADRMKDILDAVRQHFIITEGVGVELHPDNVTVPVLRTLKEAGVTKLSIGIQSFQKKYQTVLGRKTVDAAAMSEALAAVPFETVSMDFIFALPGQTLRDLAADVDAAFTHGANHIAIYPFIDFTFTPGKIRRMPEREKRRLLDGITAYCLKRGCIRTSVWTFAREKGAGYSSMTRETYLGFGCSAATLLRGQFKINTFSVEEYCRRMERGESATALTCRFSRRQRMVYYLFWAAYSTRVDAGEFERFFGIPLKKMYGMELKLAEWLGFIRKDKDSYIMTPKGAYYYHYYENFYTLSYIDKMWGVLRNEAFPKRLTL